MQALVIFAYHYSNNPQPCSPPAPHASNNSTALQIYAEAKSNENELVRFSLPRRNSICGALATNIRRSRVQSKCFCYAEAQQYKWRDSVKYTKKFAFPGEMLTFAQVKFELFKFSPAMPALDAIYYNF